MKKVILFSLISIFSLNLFAQVHWTKHPANPVMVASEEWEGDYVLPRSVIFLDSLYHMWYWGATDNYLGYEAIAYAISQDGINWKKDPNNPVLEPGPEGAWDDHIIHGCSVILLDSIFHMWYNGHSGQNSEKNWGIGHATSPDGIHWAKDTNNPVMVQGQVGEWDELEIELNSVIHDGDNFQMWYDGVGYNGGRWSVRGGHAISPDGINWMEDSLNPVLISEYDWEGEMVFFLNTVFDGTNYKMWYTGGSGYNWQVGYATSDDGSIWQKYEQNPVLSTGPAGSWDQKHVGAGPVIDSAGVKYKMWYIGGQNDNTQRIGYAESSPYVEIPDTAFLNALIEVGVDTNGDSLISYEEAEAVISLNVKYKEISDMTGIEAFINLETLICTHNDLTSLDVSGCTSLIYLACWANKLNSLDVSGHTSLKKIVCNGDKLTSLDASGCSALTELNCIGNQLTSLDVSGCTALTELNCRENHLTSLDVSGLTALTHLECQDNQLTSLDVSCCTALTELNCRENHLTSLDVSGCTALKDMDCCHNDLISLDLSTNKAIAQGYENGLGPWVEYHGLCLEDMPTITEVCIWETFSLDSVNISTRNSPNVCFQTDCNGDCSIVGIVDDIHESGIFIYPNPANNMLTIETGYPDHYSIEIATLNGQQILAGEMEGSTLKVDLSSLRKGVYFITIRSEDFVTTRKIIKL